VETFAVHWDRLPELIHGHGGYRVIIIGGHLIPRMSVIGQLAPDGAVELIELELPAWR
jgi:hypothetical protein